MRVETKMYKIVEKQRKKERKNNLGVSIVGIFLYNGVVSVLEVERKEMRWEAVYIQYCSYRAYYVFFFFLDLVLPAVWGKMFQ